MFWLYGVSKGSRLGIVNDKCPTMKTFASISLLVSLVFLSPLVEASGLDGKAIVVGLEIEGADLVVDLNGLPLPGEELLSELGEEIEENGPEHPVVVLIHDGVPFSAMTNMRGVLEKVGFLRIRYFYFGDDKRMMGELRFLSAVPFRDKSVMGE